MSLIMMIINLIVASVYLRLLQGAPVMTVRQSFGVIGRYVFAGFVFVFFALPLLWLLTAPFDTAPTVQVSLPDFTLENFRTLWDNPYAMRVAGQLRDHRRRHVAITLVLAALASYALSPGADPRPRHACSTRCSCCRRSSPGRRPWCRSSC